MANPKTLPLCEKVYRKSIIERTLSVIVFYLFLCLLSYRLHSLSNHGFAWLLAFVCESWFTFIWLLNLITRWNPTEHKTYPENLLPRLVELPPVDMFVTTADPLLEPPLVTINTVLSLLSVDYPAEKLACYVSDDGCSPLTFYSLVEASKFAQLWVPFCKKYDVQVRAPFQYFTKPLPLVHDLQGFRLEWQKMKDEYEKLCGKIEDAAHSMKLVPHSPEYSVFLDMECNNHPSIVKVIWENKKDQNSSVLPHLVYVSREKRLNHPHHYKAGAMNALTRVSGLMTNAPFMVNVDCDMFASNPKAIQHGVCALLGVEDEQESGFAQCFFEFYNALEDDPFGNQLLLTLNDLFGRGMAGIQGPSFIGTGCFHRRKVIYGMPPILADNIKGQILADQRTLEEILGNSREFNKSVAEILSGSGRKCFPQDISSTLELASRVADCDYENNTCWGKELSYLPSTNQIETKISLRAWWNGHRMERIVTSSSMLLASLIIFLKLLGLTETVFEVTKKSNQHSSSNDDDDEKVGRFTFNESPIFVPGTTLLMVHLTALATWALGWQPAARGGEGSGIAEILCSIWVVMNFWPFLRELFRKGKYGIPLSIIWKSAALALLFVQLSKWKSVKY